MLTLLNTSIITAYGEYTYKPISLEEARALLYTPCPNCLNGCPVCNMSGLLSIPFDSAIGHQATAEILTELLGVSVPMNRIEYQQQPHETAIVFKLKARVPEGTILNQEQIEQIGYEFGLLYRLA